MRIVDHLGQQHDVIGGLENLQIAVVRPWQHAFGQPARDAPFPKRTVFP
jgi:hypothetical protein